MIIPVFLFSLGTTQQSCKTKEGCGLEEKYAPDMEAKRKDAGLFSKKQRKKMKKKS
jgi:hypothetical protein